MFGGLAMWSDNETTIDLIGFKVHSDLILDVVTNPELLPVVLGVFGDWGGGKSSIMRMLEQSLEADKYKDVVCLYFNGWTFEGYEDAKTALISSILVQLGEHKDFGEKAKDGVVALLKRVKWMEVAKLSIKHVGVPLALGALTGGVGAIPAILASLIPSSSVESSEKAKTEPQTKDTIDSANWLDLIETDTSKPDLLEVRKFREDFGKLLDKTGIKSLVVLIDDLDRCLPPRIIETLEAIKLFVSVPKTAFVIGADPRIVRHAIATRYVARQLKEEDVTKAEEYDLVKDYLEKLIQIPYHLPRLSPAEIETYINLLACQKYLNKEQFSSILEHWQTQRSNNFYAAYRYDAIKDALGTEIDDELERQLVWSNSVAQAITEGLKGNPRQVKRMLNAMLLRKKLAEVANLPIRDDILAKLMVLEYTNLNLFKQLNNWQTSEKGFPIKLKQLEDAIREEIEVSDDTLKEWQKPAVKTWIKLHPPISDIDLRDYFWLARDKTDSLLSDVKMVAPIVRRIFNQLVGDNEGEQHIGARETAKLNTVEQETLLELLIQHIERHPDQESGIKAIFKLIENKVEGSLESLLRTLEKLPSKQLFPGIAFYLKTIAMKNSMYEPAIKKLLGKFQKEGKSKISSAASSALKGWE